jgi:hypothetical protein
MATMALKDVSRFVLTGSATGVVRAAIAGVRATVRGPRLPDAANAERNADRAGPSPLDPGVSRVIKEAVEWICRAQSRSTSRDGGVARHYSLIDGWSASYPETTGYIVPTLLAYASASADEAMRARAMRMLDWLVSIQLPDGGFQGGTVGATPVVPVTFNTGQILLGLAAGVEECGAYEEALMRAADWLVEAQDADGAWRRFPSPFAAPGEKTYDTHAAWGLLQAARVRPDAGYADAALANVRWALSHQHENGWMDRCCLSDARQPVTHTIGYALRGVIEAYRFSSDQRLLESSLRMADGLLSAMRDDGYLPGRLDRRWRATVPWVCLTGTMQIAACWLLLHRITGERKYLDAGTIANRYVRRTVKVDGRPDTRGAVKGSFPVSGEYGQFQYLSWAGKFLVDANVLERELRDEDA